MDKQKVLQKKYLIMPDSFKGTMDSIEVCEIMKSAVLEKNPGAEVVTVPVADGGEGTVDCFLSAFGGKENGDRRQDPTVKKYRQPTALRAILQLLKWQRPQALRLPITA